ncbi:hypothetical protein ACOI1C_12200 [Bacillus sp. DJP31]|uniref:hypothetical protein n=1 Tax=Bacillus sp. DJP31 TaxID=3409789 RepID=UPI003BB73091
MLEQDDLYPLELQAYLEENYNPLVADLERLLNTSHVFLYISFAYWIGYQLKPTNIDIKR